MLCRGSCSVLANHDSGVPGRSRSCYFPTNDASQEPAPAQQPAAQPADDGRVPAAPGASDQRGNRLLQAARNEVSPAIRPMHSTLQQPRPGARSCRKASHEPPAEGNPAPAAAVAARVRADRVRRRAPATRLAHLALRAVGAGDRAAGRAAQPRDRVGGREDRRRRRRPAQRDARQPDRTGDRAHRAEGRRVHAGQGIDRGRHRHQHALHARHVVPARWAEVPHPGIQPGQRTHAGRPALPRGGRAACAVRGRRHRGVGAGGVHVHAERRPLGAADRGLRARHAVLPEDAQGDLRERGARRGGRGRGAVADGARARRRSP